MSTQTRSTAARSIREDGRCGENERGSEGEKRNNKKKFTRTCTCEHVSAEEEGERGKKKTRLSTIHFIFEKHVQ